MPKKPGCVARLYCPWCNGQWQAQPVLIPLVLEYQPANRQVEQKWQAYAGQFEKQEFRYICPRVDKNGRKKCWFSEIHTEIPWERAKT